MIFCGYSILGGIHAHPTTRRTNSLDFESGYRLKTFGAATAIASYGSKLNSATLASSATATMSLSKVTTIAKGDRIYVSIIRTRDNRVLSGAVVSVK